MPFTTKSKKTGRIYTLHARKQKLRGGHEVTLYFFAAKPSEDAVDALPEGYEVTENQKTGLPLLKKRSG